MTISPNPNAIQPPTGFTRIDPTDPDSQWGADDLDVGLEYTIAWSPEHGIEIYAGLERVSSADIVAAINDLIACYVGVRNAEAEHAANVARAEGQA